MLGAGDWNVFITERGGGTILYEVPFSAFYMGRRLNDVSNATVQLAGNCCEFLTEILPCSHEIVAFRDGIAVWSGPITDMLFSEENASISARDLSQWFDWRVVVEDRSFGEDDLGHIFRTLARDALAQDPSPNITLQIDNVGVVGTRTYRAFNFEVIGDKLRELTRTGLDFTVRGRSLIAGGLELLLDSIRLTDVDVRTATATIDGLSYATQVFVLGAEISQDSRAQGMAEAGSEQFGLIQRSFVEGDIQDNLTAQQNARSRLASVQPAPLNLNVTLDAQASFTFDQLVPGCRVDTRLGYVAGCPIPFQDMRMTSAATGIVAANEGLTEYTNITLAPMGAEDDGVEVAE